MSKCALLDVRRARRRSSARPATRQDGRRSSISAARSHRRSPRPALRKDDLAPVGRPRGSGMARVREPPLPAPVGVHDVKPAAPLTAAALCVKAIFEFAAAPRLDRAESAGDAICDCALRPKRAKSATPTSATRVTIAPRRRRRRRPRCLASSISASTRASNSPCVTGSLGRGGRGGAVTVTTTSVVRLS